MKIKAIVRAFYNGSIVKPGEIVEFKGSKVPSWAKEVNKSRKPANNSASEIAAGVNGDAPAEMSKNPEIASSQAPRKDGLFAPASAVESENSSPADLNDTKTDDNEGESKSTETFDFDLSQKTEEELNEILDDLFTKAAEKNILIDLEGKTVIEQIEDLKNAIERG